MTNTSKKQSKEVVLRLNDLVKQELFIKRLTPYSELKIRPTNIDDIFKQIYILGIKKIKVDLEVMLMIVSFVLAVTEGYTGKDSNKSKLELIQNPIIDKFFGVELILE